MADQLETAQNKAAEVGTTTSSEEATNWLQLTKENYRDSTTYLDENFRRQWARNLDLFHNRHPSGSKYNSADYAKRSRVFRPKSRTSVRKNEAAVAAAFFSTNNVVDIGAEDDSDPKQLANSKLIDQLLQYRLTKSIPWFQIVIGACQDAQVIGVCASKQTWKFEERVSMVERPVVYDDGTVNETETIEVEEREIRVDKPACDLIPIEFLRLHPRASWIDPVQESPYLIHIIPMYVQEVRERMKLEDRKTGQPPWNELSDGEIAAGKSFEVENDETSRDRSVGKRDASSDQSSLQAFEIVYVFENHIRWEGEDWVYYTLADQHLLSEPVLLEDVYPIGERPFVIGCSVIEAHRPVPAGKVELTQNLQHEANEVANLRMDGVKYAMLGKWVAESGKEIDFQNLKRGVPGSVVMTNDIEALKWERPTDVSGSGFAEQDRINMDFDDLAGNFSSASVATNRSLNETVGGMQLMSGSANAITELDLRIFSETWVEKVIRQLAKLEQVFETDEVILTIAAKEAKLMEKFGVTEIDDDLMQNEVTITVNVGVGAVDPMQKVIKLDGALKMLMPFLGPLVGKINIEALAEEVFGAAGYRDGKRFFNIEGDDMRVDQLMAMIEKLMEQIEDEKAERDLKLQLAKIGADADLEEQRLENEGRMAEAKLKGRLELMKGMGERGGKAAADTAARRSTQGLDLAKMGLEAFLTPPPAKTDKTKAA